MAERILVTGGARSGKSLLAITLARRHPPPRALLATLRVADPETGERVSALRRARGDAFVTIEEPVRVGTRLAALARSFRAIVLDDLVHFVGNAFREGSFPAERRDFLRALGACRVPVVLVTEEIGFGAPPSDLEARRVRDAAAELGRDAARACSAVVLLVAGEPLWLRGAPAERGPEPSPAPLARSPQETVPSGEPPAAKEGETVDVEGT